MHIHRLLSAKEPRLYRVIASVIIIGCFLCNAVFVDAASGVEIIPTESRSSQLRPLATDKNRAIALMESVRADENADKSSSAGGIDRRRQKDEEKAFRNYLDIADYIRAHWQEIKEKGAFVFDIDGTLMAIEDLKMSIADLKYRELREILSDMLEEGFRVVIITANAKDKQFVRVIKEIRGELDRRGKLTAMKNLIAYTCTGATRTDFNEDGTEIVPSRESKVYQYNLGNSMSSEMIKLVVEILTDAVKNTLSANQDFLAKAADDFRSRDYEANGNTVLYPGNSDSYFKNYKVVIYGQGDLPLPEFVKGLTMYAPWIEARDKMVTPDGERFAQLTIKPLPDGKGKPFLVRQPVVDILIERLGQSRYRFICGGASSIDIILMSNSQGEEVNKALAVKNLIASEGLDAGFIFYFGDEYHTKGASDEPVVAVLGKNAIAVCKAGEESGARRIGDDYKTTFNLFRTVFFTETEFNYTAPASWRRLKGIDTTAQIDVKKTSPKDLPKISTIVFRVIPLLLELAGYLDIRPEDLMTEYLYCLRVGYGKSGPAYQPVRPMQKVSEIIEKGYTGIYSRRVGVDLNKITGLDPSLESDIRLIQDILIRILPRAWGFIDDEVLPALGKLAAENNTTTTALLQGYLDEIDHAEEGLSPINQRVREIVEHGYVFKAETAKGPKSPYGGSILDPYSKRSVESIMERMQKPDQIKRGKYKT